MPAFYVQRALAVYQVLMANNQLPLTFTSTDK